MAEDLPFECHRDGSLSELLGGRAIDDAKQLAMSVRQAIKDYFPINEVPTELVEDMEFLFKHADTFTKQLRYVMERANAFAEER